MPKGNIILDMTPMVDLAFLLVTFFMLTSQFRSEEPVTVDTPNSVSEIKVPDKDVMLLTVDSAGRVFFNIDGKEIRANSLKEMGRRYQIEFSEKEILEFSRMQSFGISMNLMKNYINANESQRKDMSDRAKGIPMDTINSLKNELYNWVDVSRRESFNKSQEMGSKNQLRYAIKADGETNYRKIKKIIKMFQSEQVNVNNFMLVTDLEQPEGAK